MTTTAVVMILFAGVAAGEVAQPLLVKHEYNGSVNIHPLVDEGLQNSHHELHVASIFEVNSTGSLTHAVLTAMMPDEYEAEVIELDDNVVLHASFAGVTPTGTHKLLLTAHISSCTDISETTRFALSVASCVSQSIFVNYNIDDITGCHQLFTEISAEADIICLSTVPLSGRLPPMLPPLNLVTHRGLGYEEEFLTGISLNGTCSPFHHNHTLAVDKHLLETPHAYQSLEEEEKRQIDAVVDKMENDMNSNRPAPWLKNGQTAVSKINASAWTRDRFMMPGRGLPRGDFMYII